MGPLGTAPLLLWSGQLPCWAGPSSGLLVLDSRSQKALVEAVAFSSVGLLLCPPAEAVFLGA